MSTSDERAKVTAPRKKIDGQLMATISPLPPPEEVFVDWLLSLPHDISIEAAARRQLAVMDRRALPNSDVQVLRTLLAAVAGRSHWSQPLFNP